MASSSSSEGTSLMNHLSIGQIHARFRLSTSFVLVKIVAVFASGMSFVTEAKTLVDRSGQRYLGLLSLIKVRV